MFTSERNATHQTQTTNDPQFPVGHPTMQCLTWSSHCVKHAYAYMRVKPKLVPMGVHTVQ